MKLDITEVYFLTEVVKTANIKATDAKVIGNLMDKLDKEFVRLQKIEEKKEVKLEKSVMMHGVLEKNIIRGR